MSDEASTSAPKHLIVLIIVLSLAVVFVLGLRWYEGYTKSKNMEIGLRLVDAMYNYIPTEIKYQDEVLKELLSSEMYNVYSLAHDQRQLYAYVKFKGVRVIPHVLEVSPGRILYYIETAEISKDRTFQLEYECKGGRVTAINESEMFFIVPGSRGYYDD